MENLIHNISWEVRSNVKCHICFKNNSLFNSLNSWEKCSYTSVKMAKYHIFWKFLAKKHYFGNKWQNTTFSRTWVPHQFCHRGITELEFVRLKKFMWYSSLVNSSTMQHRTRIYQARVPFIKKKKKKKNLHSTRVW